MLPICDAVCSNCALNGRPRVTLPVADPKSQGGVLFLGGFPDALSAAPTVAQPFNGKRTRLLRNMVAKIIAAMPPGKRPNCYFGYTCYCSPEYNKATNRYAISVSEFTRCSIYAKTLIEKQGIDVVVAMGTDAIKALGIRGTARDRRGRIEKYTANGRTVPVVCTFDIGTVVKDHGLVQVFNTDLLKAFRVFETRGEPTQNVVYAPTEYAEVVAKLNNLLHGIENTKEGSIVELAFDTETTSVTPHIKEDRIIAMSFSWADNKGLAIPYQHKEAGFSAEQLANIRALVVQILNHPKVRILTANGNFDMRYMWARGIDMPPHAWDIMLAEHVLEEDKSGEYSLKDITRDRYPEYANYEEELQTKLAEAWQAKAEAKKAAEADIKAGLQQKMSDWWLGLEQSARLELLSNWVNKGYVAFAETDGMSVVKQIKRKGELVVPKKYHAALHKLLGKIPVSELPVELRQSGGEVPADLLTKSFEDISLGTLLYYAAMDVIMTRLIYRSQKEAMIRENKSTRALATKCPELVRVKPLQHAYLGITMPLSVELSHMQLDGIRFDRDKAREYQATIDEQVAVVADKMKQLVGVAFNPNSTADLTNILYGDLGLPKLKFTDSGAPAVDADTIKDLADSHPDVALLQLLLAYRKMSKVSGTYFNNWLKLSEYDGCLHTEFQQTGTATFRLSSNNPKSWALCQ